MSFAGLHRWFVAFLAFFALVAWGGTAAARGSYKIAATTLEEDEGNWKLAFTIDYGSVPHLAHIPMVFTFKQVAIYERALTDEGGDKPVERTVPVDNAVPNNVPVDVGFSNAKGEMFQVTKFGIKLSRKSDFEAGEYDLTIKTSEGAQIGGTTRLKLKGKNKVINRKAISFDAPPPKPGADKPAPTKVDPEPPKAAEDMGPDLSDIPDEPADDGDGSNGKVAPKQGGCGCELASSTSPGQWWLGRWWSHAGGWLSLAFVAAAARRRRNRR